MTLTQYDCAMRGLTLGCLGPEYFCLGRNAGDDPVIVESWL
jgi:hypothetical protein